MRTIAVVCAPPPHLNAGMHSVDLAFDAVARRHSLAATIRYFSLHTPDELSPSFARGAGLLENYGLPFGYERLRSDPGALQDADVVVYWGDFQHSRGYRHSLAERLYRMGLAASTAQACEEIDRHLFLSEAPPDVLKKVVVFGECLLLDGRGPVSPHLEMVTRLVQGARMCRMRDVYSALRVANLRGDLDGSSYLGTDCALLLQRHDTERLVTSAWSDALPADATVGVFFGRTKCPEKLLLGFAREVVERMDAEAEWLPWFGDGVARPREADKYFPELRFRGAAYSLGDLYGVLSRYQFVITDAYHLCVNAWRQGIPAACVGAGVSSLVRAREKKKEAFHLMYDAARFYTFAEDLAVDAPRLVAGVTASLRDCELVRAISGRLRSHAQAAERVLVAELQAMLR